MRYIGLGSWCRPQVIWAGDAYPCLFDHVILTFVTLLRALYIHAEHGDLSPRALRRLGRLANMSFFLAAPLQYIVWWCESGACRDIEVQQAVAMWHVAMWLAFLCGS